MWNSLTRASSRLLNDEEYQKAWLQKIAVSFVLVVLIHLWNTRPKPPQQKVSPIRRRVVAEKETQPVSSVDESESKDERIAEAETSSVVDKSDHVSKTQEVKVKDVPEAETEAIVPPSNTTSASTRTTASKTPTPPAFLHGGHPGMEAYWHWHDVETSLYRVYTIASRQSEKDSFTAVPPFNPSSRRGNVRIHLEVKNGITDPISVFWVDYKGKEVPKGTIQPRQMWTQTTYIDHPWVFRTEKDLLLFYIPYRVIPTTSMAPTTDRSDQNAAVQRFTIRPSHQPTTEACRVDDPILPFPAAAHLITPQLAVEWALLHCVRTGFVEWDLLIKCGSKIVQHPEDAKYRSMRLANRQFGPRLWQTAARGVMLGAGFYENRGWVQVGVAHRERVQELSIWIWMVQQWKERAERETPLQQPEGVDGFGRAGYGRAGAMS